MTLISGQCEDATLTKLALRTTYEVNCNKRNLVNFLNRLELTCYESNDNGLSYKPYKVVVAVNSLYSSTNLRADDPHGFKEEVKVKQHATMAIVGKFPNGIAFVEQLLKEDAPSKTWDDYCVLGSNDQLAWEEKADKLGKAMHY